ncbi:response regulator transcription factor [Leptolyngbya sp. NIES-2104]|uniref:response regulator transcription factor n=1 Tax=Leptolyngbya sp. NIES-2104 TaxID=1552121 RepID=UPI0006ECA5CA|nr:response regulator transcription factor [Leptolyngbya sp. NIES-2104]GAP98011.1 two-component response regulator [Leptolyngbya sp. NIES-2104]
MTKPIRVLVADDHPIVREGIVSLITDQPDMIVVAEAEDGQSAIELFSQHQPDVTLMDLRMPNVSGSEAIARIRRDAPSARIIILTTYDGDEDIYRGLQAGAMSYLLKDVPRQELIGTIRTVYAGRKQISGVVAEKLIGRMESETISDRECEVLRLIAAGKNNREISQALKISEGTVKSHINSILHKFEVDDRTHAVVLALKRGIIGL